MVSFKRPRSLRNLRGEGSTQRGSLLSERRNETLFLEKEEPMSHHTDLNLVSFHELCEHSQDVFNLIARRAFEIFESRGYVHGNDQGGLVSRGIRAT